MLARRSLPPCLSIIAIPTSTPCLRDGSRNEGLYLGEQMRGIHSRATPSFCRTTGPPNASSKWGTCGQPHFRKRALPGRHGPRGRRGHAADCVHPVPRRDASGYVRQGGIRPRLACGGTGRECATPAGIRSPVCPLNRLCLSKRPTEGVLLSAGPCCSLADYRLTQRPVGRKQVVLGERTRLIQDFVIHDSYVTPASPSGDRLMGPVGVPKAIREDWACCADGRRNSPASFPDAGHAWHRVEPAQPLYLDRPVSVGDVKGYVQATPPALGLRSRSIWARTRG